MYWGYADWATYRLWLDELGYLWCTTSSLPKAAAAATVPSTRRYSLTPVDTDAERRPSQCRGYR